ncbi:phosphotransferase enzyme family protein [Alcanivorax balearicus MACL04]|uniref:Phosphotransferase enzyme family protein n=1 Tax=Alloalcanivorax balearicus MACL04 TaxID=1177182 RepID=A0ABT2R2U6_9GAMM|nr:phosphotransferase family protein [Alloalcanivorax balearicus]MCU5784115.1 phosphotransferase enzyme family protein [Alloalcanivorax balearicus MACL04]
MEGQPELVPVLEAHRFDESRLSRYLDQAGLLAGALRVQQFQGGQSNPTYLLESGERRYVLRKKPPGKVLPSAHQVDREYRVMKALGEHSDVPVPTMRALCEDDDVIGTSFYVMDFVPGRVFSEPLLECLPTAQQRRAVYEAMVDTLAKLHSVDYRVAGLEDFGRPQGYVARQVKRWRAQYQASKTDELPAMDNLIDWLEEHIPEDDSAAIAHGDFRMGNLLLAPDQPKVVAVLDWELATIGHPLADLAYFCLPYHLPHGIQGVRGLDGLDLSERGIPDEHVLLERYCRGCGRDGISDWPVFLAFALFRTAAILQGVYARALQGNASNRDALEVGKRAGLMAERGWQIARTHQ